MTEKEVLESMSDMIEQEVLEICPMDEPPRLLIEGAPMVHELKCWPSAFRPTVRGEKTAEFRKVDRPFMVGDILHLREWAPVPEKYTGHELRVEVTHILRGPSFGVPDGYCMMSLRRENEG